MAAPAACEGEARREDAAADEALLERYQRAAFGYFLRNRNPANGLYADNSRDWSPISIAVVGFALSAYPVAVERGWIAREEAVEHCAAALRFFRDSNQDGSPDSTGYKGFYFHFLDRDAGTRVSLRAVDDRHRAADRRRAHGKPLLRRRHPRRGGAAFDRRPAVPAHRLVLVAERRRDDHAGLEARMRLPALRLGGLQRGDRAVRARAGFAHAPDRPGLLPRVDQHLPVGKHLRPRLPVCRAAVHPSVLARVERLPRHPRPLHAREGLRLLREQPPCRARATRLRLPPPARPPPLSPGPLGLKPP